MRLRTGMAVMLKNSDLYYVSTELTEGITNLISGNHCIAVSRLAELGKEFAIVKVYDCRFDCAKNKIDELPVLRKARNLAMAGNKKEFLGMDLPVIWETKQKTPCPTTESFSKRI